MGRGIDPVHPSVCPSVLRPSIVVLVRSAPLKAPPKKSNSQRATFFRSHVNDRRRLARVRVVIPQ